jgi:hypothetical protein
LDFITQVTLHIPRAAVTRSVTGAPPRGRHLVRRYGLYSSRGRGTWKDRPALARPSTGMAGDCQGRCRPNLSIVA